MIRRLAILAPLALAGCVNATTPDATGTAAIAAGTTLAGVAAANNTTVAKIVTNGQLFCSGSVGLFAVVNGLATPTSVIGQTAAVVAAACKAVDAIAVPVSPPVAASAVPVVVKPGVLPSA